MIGSLRGVVIERNQDSTVLLEVGGVGYLIHVTPRTLGELEPTSQAFIYVHQHIREDAQTLYGFLDRDERSQHTESAQTWQCRYLPHTRRVH
jgi:Holliday junction DNA helicase RuvA